MKKGCTFGAFAVFGYYSNTGVKYSGILKLFDYGDGSKYPAYNQNLHFELSRTTKGSGINQLKYDTRTLIPGIRILAEASYLTEKVLDFYGFNGYNAYYNPAITTTSDPSYVSSVFNRMDREMIKIKLEFTGKLKGKNFNWFGGFEYLNNNLDTVDIDNLNEGRDPDDLLPSAGGGLHGNFIRWGIMPESQIHVGQTGVIKIGNGWADDQRDSSRGTYLGMNFLF